MRISLCVTVGLKSGRIQGGGCSRHLLIKADDKAKSLFLAKTVI